MVGIKIGWSLSNLNPRHPYIPNIDFVALDKVPTMDLDKNCGKHYTMVEIF